MRAPGWVVAGAPGAGELAAYDDFVARTRPDGPAAAPHAEVDRPDALPPAAQVDVLPDGP